MKPRSERRRDERKDKDTGSRRWPINIWATAFIGVGVTIIVVGAVFFLSDSGDDGSPEETPAASASATSSVLTAPVTPDEIALEALARRMIEALPNLEWPSLYPEFTDDYRQRCSLEEFTAVGEAATEEQGANLTLIRYVGVESFNVSEPTARLTIVGEIIGRSQYTTGADFEKVDRVWRIAPVADTSGCEAFDRLAES